MKSLRDGAFILLEGPEGSGKTTQTKLLNDALQALGFETLMFRSPGGTPEGEEIRNLLLHSPNPLTLRTELLLFLADRAAIVERAIKPALKDKKVAIGDRFDISTFAYQVAGRGLPLDPVMAANDFAKAGLAPDIVFYLEIEFDVAQRRLMSRGRKLDKIESAGDEFHRKVYEGYEKYIRLYQGDIRLHVPSAITQQSPELVHEHIMKSLGSLFSFD